MVPLSRGLERALPPSRPRQTTRQDMRGARLIFSLSYSRFTRRY